MGEHFSLFDTVLADGRVDIVLHSSSRLYTQGTGSLELGRGSVAFSDLVDEDVVGGRETNGEMYREVWVPIVRAKTGKQVGNLLLSYRVL